MTLRAKLTMLCLTLSSLAGCASNPARVGVEYCDHAKPVMFDTAQQVDQTPKEIRRQILEGNETYARLCRK